MSMEDPGHSLVLRLAGPLQSWGNRSQYNRRETASEPTKSGVLGLLAAALGRRRSDPIEDLLGLQLGVRTDRPGRLLRDYHTASDYRGNPLPSAAVLKSGRQKPTSPAKYTAVTRRFYLEDAVFVAALHGHPDFLVTLSQAVAHPGFPLALGRRSCVPTQPILIRRSHASDDDAARQLWPGLPAEVLANVPWQGGRPGAAGADHITLAVTVDDPAGNDTRDDVPASFHPQRRAMSQRRVRHEWIAIATGASSAQRDHDPFLLLGW